MSDPIARFTARHPVVWHAIEAEGAATCETLRPAEALRLLAGAPPDNRNRVDFERLTLGPGQTAVLRRQLMRDRDLLSSLAGEFAGRPDLWRVHIDRHVFFWASPDRLQRFVRASMRMRAQSATAMSTTPPVVLVLDTARLLHRHVTAAFFSTINSGSSLRGGARARRDEMTLRPISGYRGEIVAELAIRDEVDLSGLRVR